MENGFQAQARICPICIDDHGAHMECRKVDLIDRVKRLREESELKDITIRQLRKEIFALNGIIEDLESMCDGDCE